MPLPSPRVTRAQAPTHGVRGVRGRPLRRGGCRRRGRVGVAVRHRRCTLPFWFRTILHDRLFSGGDAFRRVYQSLADGIRLSIRSSRHQIPPRGVVGGGDGKPGRAILNPDGEPKLLSSREVNIPINFGESFALETPSGGGCGESSESIDGTKSVA